MIQAAITGKLPSDLRRVTRYYDETWLDYRLLWLNPDNMAVHFGYWDEHTRSHAESLVNMNRALAERLGLRPGSSERLRILDAGCGVGGSAIWLAKTYGAQVVGITPVRSQIERARLAAQQHGVAHLATFDQQDYMHAAFPDQSFDVFWALESACHAPDKRAFLIEAKRLLKAGGRLGLVEYFRHARPYSQADERLLHNWLSGWAIPDIATATEFVNWAQAAGFTGVRVEDISQYTRPSHQRLYRLTMLCYPVAILLRKLGVRSETQHGNTRGARDQWRALQRGLWFEGILTATA